MPNKKHIQQPDTIQGKIRAIFPFAKEYYNKEVGWAISVNRSLKNGFISTWFTSEAEAWECAYKNISSATPKIHPALPLYYSHLHDRGA